MFVEFSTNFQLFTHLTLFKLWKVFLLSQTKRCNVFFQKTLQRRTSSFLSFQRFVSCQKKTCTYLIKYSCKYETFYNSWSFFSFDFFLKLLQLFSLWKQKYNCNYREIFFKKKFKLWKIWKLLTVSEKQKKYYSLELLKLFELSETNNFNSIRNHSCNYYCEYCSISCIQKQLSL